MGLNLFRRKQERGAGEPLKIDADPLLACLQQGRYGLVASQPDPWRDNPNFEEVYAGILDKIDEAFALVPEGYVSMPRTVTDYPGCPEIDVETEPFLLSRTLITNAQFQLFVDGGGYEQLDFWPEEIWPHLVAFKDQTEFPGPRYWSNGRYDPALAQHPVVGVCFYEALAYANWAGFRLPTEAEWQMAASWRIRSSSSMYRRYPWGESFDAARCNTWASGIGSTVEVGSYENGAAPNGVIQLIGNVWEWTASNFEVVDDEGRPVVGDTAMKSVRGGSFDTYFAAQATSDFRTGVCSLSRPRNAGFRCALDVGSVDG